MAPNSRIILTRHAQAEHNVGLDYSSMYSIVEKTHCYFNILIVPDAPLTPLGKKQAASLAPQIPKLQKEADLIVSSPLKRTLQTTKLGWGPAVERLGIKNVICIPQAQECNEFPCDTGSPKETLEKDPEFADFDLSRLTPDWTSKRGFWSMDHDAIANRAKWVRQFMRDRPEKNIVLVAHGDILRAITSSPNGFSPYGWKNAEVRIFDFDPKWVDKDECYLHEETAVGAAGGYAPTSTEADLILNAVDEKL